MNGNFFIQKGALYQAAYMGFWNSVEHAGRITCYCYCVFFRYRHCCGLRPGEAHTICQLPKQSMNGNSH